MVENTKDKYLVQKNENVRFFDKILSFFKKIFKGKQEEQLKEIKIEETNSNEKNDFKENIKIDTQVEADQELLELQSKLRSGTVRIEELTEEQEDQLIDLYDKQIAIKKAKIEELKRKIEKAKKDI